jgi:hypothetical protein
MGNRCVILLDSGNADDLMRDTRQSIRDQQY